MPGVHMLRLYLSYNTATSKIPRDDLIQRCKAFEPNYSPKGNIPNKSIYMKWLQHKLRITEDLVETVTVMINSALPDGVTIHECKKVSLKLIHEELALTNCMYLSVSCAVSLPTNCSMKTIGQYLKRKELEVIDGVFSTPTRVRHSPHFYRNEYLPRFNIEEFGGPMITTRNLVQNEKSCQQPARYPRKARCHFECRSRRLWLTLVCTSLVYTPHLQRK